jgi:hypothetical protein
LRSRLARSGPGGPAQPLQVSRLHPHAPCLTCATSPRPTPPPPHSRTRTEIVITRAGILGLRSRLARSGPGGPAQPLQVSRLHPHAPCLTCATSPRPTPHPPHSRTRTEIVITRAGILGLRSRLARSGPGVPHSLCRFPGSIHTHHVSLAPPHPVQHPHPPHSRTRTEIVITRAGILGLRSRLARSGPGGPAQPLQVSRLHPHAPCLTCATSPRPTPPPPTLSNPD